MSKEYTIDQMKKTSEGYDRPILNACSLCSHVNKLQAMLSQLLEQRESKTEAEIQALIEKYGDPEYKTNEFALIDVIGVCQQLRIQLLEQSEEAEKWTKALAAIKSIEAKKLKSGIGFDSEVCQMTALYIKD